MKSPPIKLVAYFGEYSPIMLLINPVTPYPTDAVTETRPIKLSQPVKNPAFAPPSFAAHH